LTISSTISSQNNSSKALSLFSIEEVPAKPEKEEESSITSLMS
jgi:hypothetical protein